LKETNVADDKVEAMSNKEHRERVLANLLRDCCASFHEQDRDPETRKNSRGEEYTWKYADEWWLLGCIGEYLEDQSDERASSYRWLARAKHRPYKAGEEGYVWFCAGRIAEGLDDGESDLPEEIYDELQGVVSEEQSQKRYATCLEALVGASEAFGRSAAKGWVPPEPKEE
jgi:hypothetical protein